MSILMTTTLLIALLVGLVIGAVIALIQFRRLIQRHLSSLYASVESGGIEELKSIDIGGIPQWLHIRGRKKENPILLFIHGGPGMSHIGWHDAIQRPWEDFFTVVQWDQRQAGKSYQPMQKIGDSITGKQYIADAEEVVRYIRQTFGQPRIFIMGASYGTYIGMHLAKKHPNWFYAYIGVGQMSNMIEHVVGEYDLLVDYAKRENDQAMLARLNDLAPYPSPDATARQIFFEESFYIRDQACRLEKSYPGSLADISSVMKVGKLISPLYTLKEFFNTHYRKNFSERDDFLEELLHCNLVDEVGNRFDTPIFFFTGINDFHISHLHTDPWFEAIEAPYKEQVFFNRSACVPHQTEPGEFLLALVNKVLPMAGERYSQGGEA
ncbi:alpha/beta fold hydrolase [SAR92 clade bacterium H246]